MSDDRPFDPTDIQAQEADRAERERLQALEDQTQIEDWQWLMAEKRGRRIVWRLLEGTGMYRLSFTGDANTTFFREGERNVGLRITALVLAAAPHAYSLMGAEQRQ